MLSFCSRDELAFDENDAADAVKVDELTNILWVCIVAWLGESVCGGELADKNCDDEDEDDEAHEDGDVDKPMDI